MTHLKEIFQGATASVAALAGVTKAFYLMFLYDRKAFFLQASFGFESPPAASMKIDLGSISIQELPKIFSDIQNYPPFVKELKNTYKVDKFLAFTIFWQQNYPNGVIILPIAPGEYVDEYSLQLLRQLINNISTTVTKARLLQKFKDQSIKDGLTGLFNHRYFQDHLKIEIELAKKSDYPLSLILIDVDYFKLYNDTNGHPEGDALLKGLAAIFTREVRTVFDPTRPVRRPDFVSRYGGEEFVMVLPKTPKDGAKVVAERLRKAVEEYPFRNRESQPAGKLTISLGLAEYPSDAQDNRSLIQKSDEALYQAKQGGRNMVVTSLP